MQSAIHIFKQQTGYFKSEALNTQSLKCNRHRCGDWWIIFIYFSRVCATEKSTNYRYRPTVGGVGLRTSVFGFPGLCSNCGWLCG